MGDVRVMVLRAAGINCDEETMHCWQLAGAKPELWHINALAKRPGVIDDFSIVTIPGGFSYGDDIGAGVILAQRMLHDLKAPLERLVERGGGILGICNGFQVLVKLGLLPGGEGGRDEVTVTYNDSAKFEARWVRLEVQTDRCPFLTPTSRAAGFSPRGTGTGTNAADLDSQPRDSRFLEMPVEHAEGRVVTVSDAATERLAASGSIALRYVDAEGRTDTYPANPNGSSGGIAGLCDSTGRVFGLMPHPDRHFDHTHHPEWTRRTPTGSPDGLAVFQSAVGYWRGV